MTNPASNGPMLEGGHSTSHAGNGYARTAHRHHPYDVPHSGRRTSPADTTPSPISTEESSELPPPHANNDQYCTPSTSPFLHAVRNMNVGRSRTSSRVPSRAPSPIPLHLPPAVTAQDTSRALPIRRTDRHHRSHRSHPILNNPQEARPVDTIAHHPYPHSHGGTPPGTPAPLTMRSRSRRTNTSSTSGTSGTAGASGTTSKHSIDALLSNPVSSSSAGGALSSHFVIDGPTAAPTPSLSSSASHSSTASGQYRSTAFSSSSDTTMKDATMLPPLNFPPPPNRSRPSSELASPVRSAAGSPETTSTLHSAFKKHPPLPPLIPGLPSSPTVSAVPGPGRSSVSIPSSPSVASTPSSATSHSHLAHSVRIAFGMTPIHPPSFPSSRGRSTIGGTGAKSGARTRSSSPPIILAPLKCVKKEEEADVKLPHLATLTTRLEDLSRGPRPVDEMDVDDLH